ncbi:MAG: gliding motility-associated C-terminal domain-containing protein [Chitinophagaceae bacterium]|nr:gliding motility-associated C-terminal domain-containing protein [Chitinophagaceae bacterium]
MDANGNIYSAGLFNGTHDFDPGPGVYEMTADNSANTSIYISKLDAGGNFVWAVQIPTYVEFGAIELKVDKSGNVYLVSDLNIATDMDPGPGNYVLTPTGFRDAFVLKLDTDGNFVWAKQFGGPGDTGPQGTCIELDKDNNVIIGGTFNNTVDFDPGPGVLNITSSAHFQTFLVMLNNDGDLVWAKQFGNGSETYTGSAISNIKCDDSGNILVIGSFNGTCDFDPGPGVFNVTSGAGNSNNGLICKLDNNGDFVWVKTLQEEKGDNHYSINLRGITIDREGNLLITGWFTGDYDFDPGAGGQNIFAFPSECFVLKLTENGGFEWVKIIGGAESDLGSDIAVDTANNVYITGVFGNSADFDSGPGTFVINSTGYDMSAIVKLSSSGDFIFAAPFLSIDDGTSSFTRLTVDPSQNIYVVGQVMGSVDFDPGEGVFPVSVNSSPFVLKLGPCPNPSYSTISVSTCNSYTINNHTYDSSGTYFETVLNSAGCDSVITIHLTINKKLTEQTKVICEGESFFTGGDYQVTSGIYYDTLQTVLGCDSIIKMSLTVNPRPVPDLGDDKNLCKNTTLTLSPGSSFSSYLWQDNSKEPAITISDTGTYWVKVTNSFHCEAVDSITILSLLGPPSDFLPAADSVCRYKSLELSPYRSYADYQWSTGQQTRSIQVQNPDTYWLTVTDTNGCKGMDTTYVFEKECMFGVYIPNAFTPDNNGINDKFKPIIYGKVIQYHLQIFNRWGGLVFQTHDHETAWNGTINGAPQNTGVFIWVCHYQLEGESVSSKKGVVTLMR